MIARRLTEEDIVNRAAGKDKTAMRALKGLTEKDVMDDSVSRTAEARSFNITPESIREIYRARALQKADTRERNKLIIIAVAAIVICAALVAIIFN